MDRNLDEVRLPEEVLVDEHALRERTLNLSQDLIQLPRQRERIGVRLLLDGDNHAGLDDRLPIRTPARRRRRPALDRRTDLNDAEIADLDRPPVANHHDGVRDVIGCLDAPDAPDDRLLPALDQEARRDVLVAGPQRLGHIVKAKPVRPKPLRREHHLVLLFVAADRRHLRDPGHRQQAAPEVRLGDRPKLELVVAIRGQGDEQDFTHDGRHGGEQRRPHLGRKAASHRPQPFVHRLPGAIDIRAPFELDPHDSQPDGGGRPDAPNVCSAVDRCLYRERDERLHFLRRHPVAFNDDGHRWRRQVGKDVHRHRGRDVRARQQENGRNQQDGQPVRQRPTNKTLDHGFDSWASVGMARTEGLRRL